MGERLGRGASGVVFAATDEVLGREVALKWLPLGALSARARQRVLREARVIARVQHPGVAALFDLILDGETALLVLERAAGETLRARLEREGALPWIRACRIVERAARAAGAAHAAGVVHRDLKPENLMVTLEDQVKLLDFGLAAVLEGGAARGLAGTAGYQAPEQLCERASPASDQYALALILVEASTGRRHTPRDPLPRTWPRALRAVVARALSAEPAARWPSCDDFAARLASVTRPARGAWLSATFALMASALAGTQSSAPADPEWSVALAASEPPPPLQVACPQLSVPDPRDGWQGAAAANIVCKQARALLGGERERALPPAALLELPNAPGPELPRDPYGAVDARPRALTRALDSGRVVIDGDLAQLSSGVRVALRAEWQGQTRARASATGPLASAATRATRDLLAALYASAQIDPHGPSSTVVFAEAAAATGGALGEARSMLERDVPDDPRGLMLSVRMGWGMGDTRVPAPPELWDGSVGELSATSTAHVLLGGSESPASLADRLLAERGDAMASEEALALVRAEATLRLLAGEREQARSLALAAAEQDPWDAPWSVLAHASFGRPEFATLSRAHCAWAPEAADAWNIAAHVDFAEHERTDVIERAYLLGESFPLYAGNYGVRLALDGRLDEAKLVMAKLELGNAGQRAAAGRLSTELALAEGRVLGAFERGAAVLARLDNIGSIDTGDVGLLALFVELGVLLGRGEEAARLIFDHFVAPEPARVDRGPFAAQAIAHACAYATREVAERCFARLDRLASERHFLMPGTGDAAAYLEGARAFAAGDLRGAARAFRRIQTDLGGRASVAAVALERAGELSHAERLDPPKSGMFGGKSLSHARAARRALLRGDCDTARELARGIAPALSALDVEVAVSKELERTLARCCTPGPRCARGSGER